jgi:hypothetical protein
MTLNRQTVSSSQIDPYRLTSTTFTDFSISRPILEARRYGRGGKQVPSLSTQSNCTQCHQPKQDKHHQTVMSGLNDPLVIVII